MALKIKKQKIESDMEAIIIMMALKYNNVWIDIMKALEAKEQFRDEDIQAFTKKWNSSEHEWHCIIRKDYPNKYKSQYKPPFFVYHEDDKFIPRVRKYIIDLPE